jgi:hypothetical protein
MMRMVTFIIAAAACSTAGAFWDIGHAPKDQSNHHKYMPEYAAWEIHPVMKLDVKSD